MLEQVDTAIAFAVVLLFLSLLVTTIVQTVSALLDLRGKNLERGLTTLFHQMSPDLRAPASNSNWKKKLAQPLSARTLGSQLADAVATHPSVAHTFARAKAIRADELIAVLKDLCSDTSTGNIDAKAKARLKSLVATRVPGGSEGVAIAQSVIEKL